MKIVLKAQDDLEKIIYKEEWPYCTELYDILCKRYPKLKEILKMGSEALIEKVSDDIQTPQEKEFNSYINLIKWYKAIWIGNMKLASSYLNGFPDQDVIDQAIIPFVQYADKFIRIFITAATDYMKQTKKVPNYEYPLKKAFIKTWKQEISAILKSVKLDEEEFKTAFWEIEVLMNELGLDIKASTSITQSFIDACKKKYPLAKKSVWLVNNRKFKEEFIKQELLHQEKILDDMFKWIRDAVEVAMKNWILKWSFDSSFIANIVWHLAYYIKEWLDESCSLQWNYLREIVKRFADEQYQIEKKQNVTKLTKKIQIEEPEKATPVVFWDSQKTRKELLTPEQNSLIEEAVTYIPCDDKTRKNIRRYVTKLIHRKLPIKFKDFCKVFSISSVPEETEDILIRKLWLEYVLEEEDDLIMEEEDGIETQPQNNTSIEPEELEIQDPVAWFIERIESLNYIIERKNILKEQIEVFCINSSYRTKLLNLLSNPSFGRRLVHKGWCKQARAVEIWTTWWRLLLEERNWKLYVDSFCNHNDYLNRLDNMK